MLYQNEVYIAYGGNSFNTWDYDADGGTGTLTRMIECHEGDQVTLRMPGGGRYLIGQVTSLTGYRLPVADVAFHARLSASIDIRNGTAIPFDDATVNNGGFYSPDLGFFQCPDDELYVFMWSVATNFESEQREFQGRLMMSGVEVKVGPQTGKPFDDNPFKGSSSQAVVRCQQGENVYIEAGVTGDESQRLHYVWCNFLGFRLPKFEQ